MKGFKYIILLFVVGTMVWSCDEEVTGYGDAVPFERTDTVAALSVITTNVSFLVGIPSYTYDFLAAAGTSAATKVQVYKTFTNSNTGNVSNTVLLNEFDLSTSSFFSSTADFAELRDGIVVDGGDLPTNEADIAVGSKWVLTYVLVDADAAVVLDGGSDNATTIAVLSAFAGYYTVIESDYYRIGVQSGLADFTGEERFIGSINDSTFLHSEYIGPLGPSTNFDPLDFIFYKNGLNITIPPEVDGETQDMWGTYFLSCHTDFASFTSVSCIGSNQIVINGGGPGKHWIYLTYGYETVGSGTREFYELLEKIVD
ncbi:MAG: hypothetical protein GY751_01610 [Bacteroidetes bacterium]|nr:hypothetical protein [Bacteroidota bacterium]